MLDLNIQSMEPQPQNVRQYATQGTQTIGQCATQGTQTIRQCTTHGPPTHWTMCNPWNFSCNMTIYTSPICIQCLTHLQSLCLTNTNPDTSLSLPQAPSPTLPNDDKHSDAKHNWLAIKKS